MKSKDNLLRNGRLLKFFILGSSLFSAICILESSRRNLNSFKEDFSKAIAMNAQGEIISPEMIQVEELFLLEARDHLKNFMDYFFSFDQFSFSKQLQKSFSLGDNSIVAAYKRLKDKEMYYNEVIEKSIIQKINWGDPFFEIEIGEKTTHGWPFEIKTLLSINSSNEKTHHSLIAKGFLSKVKRNLKTNPHGLLISHFSFVQNPQLEAPLQ